jgi:hypothetical protein
VPPGVLPLAAMKAREMMVATHGHCFDGAASAVLFTRLVRALAPPGAPPSFRYRSCGYGPGMQMIPEGWLDGAENAILDFRYTPSPKLSWYFDHHVTGFGSPEERDVALAMGGPESPPKPPEIRGGALIAMGGPESPPKPPEIRGGALIEGVAAGARTRVFWEPTYGSCAKLIADVAAARFGVDMGPLAELVGWADVIDSARFPSAEAATAPDEPVLQLAAVIEHHGDGRFLNALVPRLLEIPPGELARAADVQAQWAPIRASRDAFVARVARAAVVLGPVVLVDISDAPIEVAAKFVTYARYPACVYSVMLTRHKQHYKCSVGYNPWCGVPRGHDIAAICQRYGGGGHPAVGACSFPLAALDKAREAARAVAEELGR